MQPLHLVEPDSILSVAVADPQQAVELHKEYTVVEVLVDNDDSLQVDVEADDPPKHSHCYPVLEQILNLSSYLLLDLIEGSVGELGNLTQSLQDDADGG